MPMTNEEAIKELNAIKESFKNTIKIIQRKRWIPSVKAAIIADYLQHIKALEYGIEALENN